MDVSISQTYFINIVKPLLLSFAVLDIDLDFGQIKIGTFKHLDLLVRRQLALVISLIGFFLKV